MKILKILIWALFFTLIGPAFFLIYKNTSFIIEWSILPLVSPFIITLIFDPKGILFSCTVLLISANVIRFSSLYIKNDPFNNRFDALVFIFVLSINFLILFPHFIILLLGWDGLGIVSFILVVYYQNPKSLAAGLITAFTNRIGDVLLLLAIGLTLNQGHWNIIRIWNRNYITTFIIIAAAITKRAQMPFSSWLPAAIAAPTPVSALVHSSTLVTAGVFLLTRFYPYLHKTHLFNEIILFIAVITIFIAGIRATTECDIKKIIALSTLRQLGIIITGLGLNLPLLTYFHIVTHALFKALLFICAGTYINSHRHSQDLRWIGNVTNQLPTATACTLIANMALCGFPFIAGFYSKDLILETSLFYSYNVLILTLIFISVGLTSFYRLRFIYAVIWRPINSSPYIRLTEPNTVSNPIIYLSISSVIVGSIIIWYFPLIQNQVSFLTGLEKSAPIVFTSIGILIGWAISKSGIPSNNLHFISCIIWFLVPLSTQFVIKPIIIISKKYLETVDQSWLEIFGGQGIHKLIKKATNTSMHFIRRPITNLII
jgi:NADH-ubiquinone oxidoreductase chain 5